MIAIAEQGYEGIALTFVNYTQELPYFCDRVLPVLWATAHRFGDLRHFAGVASGLSRSTT